MSRTGRASGLPIGRNLVRGERTKPGFSFQFRLKSSDEGTRELESREESAGHPRICGQRLRLPQQTAEFEYRRQRQPRRVQTRASRKQAGKSHTHGKGRKRSPNRRQTRLKAQPGRLVSARTNRRRLKPGESAAEASSRTRKLHLRHGFSGGREKLIGGEPPKQGG